jgi:hypothetical protein
MFTTLPDEQWNVQSIDLAMAYEDGDRMNVLIR